MSTNKTPQFASRAGTKLLHALHTFKIDARGKTCADLGSSTGGFTDCLLQHGARHVYAVDTAKNILEWKLRKDERVTVMEGTNALHVELPVAPDIITIDASWTKQKLIVPHAYALLASGGSIITLVKPHYEAPKGWLTKGKLEEKFQRDTLSLVEKDLNKLGITVVDTTTSPQVGKKGSNTEYFFLIHKS